MDNINDLYVNLKDEFFEKYLLKYIEFVKCPDTNITIILAYEATIKSYCQKYNISFSNLLDSIFKDIPKENLYYNHISSNFNIIEKEE